MKQVVCRLILLDGLWGREPSEEAVRAALRSAFSSRADAWPPGDGPSLDSVEFDDPEDDEALVAVAVVLTPCCYAESIRDDIIDILLACFTPECESMVDVEVVDE